MTKKVIISQLTVCMFSYYFHPQYSGSALQAISLARKLRDKGIKVIFLTVNHDGLDETDVLDDFRVYRIPDGKGKFGEISLWKNMWVFLKHHKDEFRIMHSHGAYLRNSFVGPLSKIYGKKSVVKLTLANNDLYGLGSGRNGRLHRMFISMVDRYVSISREISEELRGYGLPDKKIREISNGVETEKFSPISHEEKILLRKSFGLPEDGLMALYTGVVDERKNVKWLADTWSSFCNDYPGYLVVVGPISREDRDGRLYNSIKACGDRLNNKLFLFHYTDRIEKFYQMADIFVLPSTNEGMPNVVLEAMASGLSCLISKVSGAQDVMNEKNGMIFDVQRPETFSEGLFTLRNDSLRTEIGAAARETIVRDFSIESVAEKYISLYEEMLNA